MRVAYIVRSWPRLSQTFVVNEILALEQLGVSISIFAMAKADEPVVQPQVEEVVAPIRYLEDGGGFGPHARVLWKAPLRYVTTLVSALRQRQLFGGYTKSGPGTAFHRAVMVADDVLVDAAGFTHVHAHFAHDPALIGLLVRRITGLPFSFTAHARDLYQIPEGALLARAREAAAVVTCCRANVEHIAEVVGRTGPSIELVYHGVDLRMFRPAAVASIAAVKEVPLVVSVGRLVEKKGFDSLLHACAQVAGTGRRFRCEIYGDGPCQAELESLRDRLELENVVEFCGSRTQHELLDVYHRADVFVLTPHVTEDGDRDGIPNVLVEAMACGLPVVATSVAGIPELVVHGADGLLASPRDPDAVAACLTELLDDEAGRRRLGEAAARTAARFDSRVAARRLAGLFSPVTAP